MWSTVRIPLILSKIKHAKSYFLVQMCGSLIKQKTPHCICHKRGVMAYTHLFFIPGAWRQKFLRA